MKYNIIKSELDVDRLNTKIAQKDDPQYLIMNLETCDTLCVQTKENSLFSSPNATMDGVFGLYKGIPIAIYNGLKYGEVDII